MLLAWVPGAMVQRLDAAIRVNPEESICWAFDQPHPLVQELVELGLLR